jgi:sulfate transport system substrate-binding protein
LKSSHRPSVFWLSHRCPSSIKWSINAAHAKWLRYLYTDEAQDIIGKNFYRPVSEKAAKKYAGQFSKIKLFNIDDAFSGWTVALKTHFADGGVFDQIYQPNKK